MTYDKPELVLSKKILSSHKTNGFTSAIIEGARGIGKSSYALKVFHDVFISMGWNDNVAWDMALDRILYRMNDIIDFLDKSVDKKDREVGFIWDDAGVLVQISHGTQM